MIERAPPVSPTAPSARVVPVAWSNVGLPVSVTGPVVSDAPAVPVRAEGIRPDREGTDHRTERIADIDCRIAGHHEVIRVGLRAGECAPAWSSRNWEWL